MPKFFAIDWICNFKLSANNIVVGQYSKREPQNIASFEKN